MKTKTTEKKTKSVKPTPSVVANGQAEPKEGPNKPQLRILAALAKAKQPLTKLELAEKSKVDPNWIAEYVGGVEGGSEHVKRDGRLKLVAAKLAKIVVIKVLQRTDETWDTVKKYEITASGRKVAERSAK